ncbi:MAG: hypothetical protein RLZZ385_1602 [Pseudomonadota bacterium]|jgi:threonine/homoserine/homoserine lactone efflux protein
MDLLLFALVATLVIVIPGPNVLVVVATALQHGRRRGLQTVMGTSSAMVVQLTVAALGTAGLVNLLRDGFFYLKWAGVGYLTWIGVNMLLHAHRRVPTSVTAMCSFQRGFWVSLTNPKTILFFGAFLPQFVLGSEPYLPQIALLSGIFWILAVLLDSSYALLAAAAAGLLRNPRREIWAGRLGGLVYVGAATLLAGLRQP